MAESGVEKSPLNSLTGMNGRLFAKALWNPIMDERGCGFRCLVKYEHQGPTLICTCRSEMHRQATGYDHRWTTSTTNLNLTI